MEAEIRRRNSSVETSYNARYGAEWTGEGSALRQAFHDEESGPEAELYDALADNDLTRADAARLAIEEDAIFVSSDEAINGVFRHQYDRALEEVRRDQGPALRAALDAEEAEARRAGTPWDPYERRRRERMMERELETRARGVSAGYMGDLETTFETDFSRRGTIGMEMLIGMNMSGYEQDRARDLVAQGGYLTPAQEVHYAVAGTGTDEEALRRALENRSPEEIAEIRAEYARTHPGHTLDADIHDDVDGRDRFDLDMALEGEPQNAEQELDQMHRRVNWELTNSADVWGGGESRSVLTHRRDEMARAYAATVDPSLTPEERVRALERFHYTAGNTTVAVQDYRRQMDALTDTIATVAGVVAAVVVIVVATIATGGAAGPGLIAALVTTMSSGGIAAASAAATVLATIAVKQAMLGGAYGWEDVGFDVAVGLVDVAANYFTAGIGGRLLDALETVPPGMLARMAVSPRRATRMLAHAIAESAEGLVSTLPSALAGNVLRDENWRGNAFQNILLGTAMETGMGTLMSGGLGSLGGFKRMSVPSGHPAAEMLAPNRTFRQQLSDMRAFREANPTGRMRDFLAWQQGRSVREAMEQQLSAAAEREARDQLLSGMSAAERHQFADTPIRVMDDADFVRFTGSTKGNAVVVIDAGEPRVIMRAGADPSVMREEGVHLLQSIDPRTRGAVRALDEANLAGWRQMDLGRQLDLYGQKIDLEIDAHRRLIGSLEDSLDDAGGDAALRRSLETQIDRARQNLDNLTSRRADLGDITPEQRVRMSEGAEPRPQYLDEPPRLFSKDPTTPHPDTAAEAAGTARPMRADPNLERTPVTDSPLRKVKGEPDRPVYRIGPEWDAPHEGRLRKYRQVEVLDAEGRVARVREEILLDDGNWVQRGSESTRAGAAAEAASEEVTREQAARAAARGDRVIAVKTQNPDGSGFDGAQLELNADGSARIAVIEVKNYNGYVPRSEFTAVVENLQRNLDDLRAQLDSVDALTRFGITHEQQQALLAALDDGKIRLELRLAPGTQLGSYSSGSVIRDIKQAWRDAGISSNVPVKTVPIPETHMATARTRIGQMDNLGGRPRFYDLATRPDGTVSPESLGHAKVAMLAEQSGIVKPPITRTIQPGTFVDAGGQVTTVSRLQGSHLKGSAESDTVRGIIQQLRLEAPVPGGAGLTPRILLLDITGLSPVERARLRQVIREAMENLPGRDGMLRRLHLFERP
jgi:hypothetical protein